jgi:chromosome segregation ATPase
MAQIIVAKAFSLLLDGGERLAFTPGKHTVSEEVAAHWFTKLHLSDEEPDAPDADAEAVKAEHGRLVQALADARDRIQELEAEREVTVKLTVEAEEVKTALAAAAEQLTAAQGRIVELEAEVAELKKAAEPKARGK